MTGVDRRTFLIGAAAAGAISTGTAHAATTSFEHGVASGDPLPDGVLLWTRVVTSEPIRWEIARDEDFHRVVKRGTTRTSPARDHTVKVEVHGLRPDTRYWYRFRVGDVLSPVGRTKTAGCVSELNFGVVSCSNWMAGHFAGYGHLARQQDLDAVIHLGDYIYEYFNADFRAPDPPHRCVTLDDYRRRHAQYKTDRHVQALHAAHPMIATWDDHESADNSSSIGSPQHDPATEGPWAARMAAATQAYHEWMPVREGKLDRTFRFGDLATVTMLDLRSYRTDTTILGAAQRAWLIKTLTTDRARWQLVGNSVMISPFKIPPLPGFPPSNPDQWDGFPIDRELVLRSLGDRKNTVFLTGDIHSSWACDVPLNDNSAATEYVVTSLTSDNFDELLKVPPRTGSLQLEAQIQVLNPHVRFVELDSHGVSTLKVTKDEVRMDWHYVADKKNPDSAVARAHSFRTRHNTARTERVLF
ncbi:alkaline phosphatase [Lentzea sp. PSKA42]|uniref:Alkaline phosphatase n=1 Tax=Lentzea indica TaxID=2604800 RepID=A0ABX1FAQ6_9PSEU|nr:alkaline phosphatase D family protein [Lentzea indica]NKE55988.1 alkaline phosphatase [Lentzea indica]